MHRRAERLAKLVVDLYANGQRRLRDTHLEDALLRAYRILELVGQMRLFQKGYDSARLPVGGEVVEKTRAFLEKKKKEGFQLSRDESSYLAPRMPVAYLLTQLGDSLGKRLRKEADDGALPAKRRNKSLLIHGFEVSATSREQVEELFLRLETLLADVFKEEWKRWLPLAQALDFGESMEDPSPEDRLLRPAPTPGSQRP